MSASREMRAEILRALQAGELTPEEARGRLNASPYPLSEGQCGLWLAYRLDPRGSSYNVPICLRLPGLDRARLVEACRALLQRHPVLNHRFGEEGGVPYQQVRPQVDLEVDEVPPPTGDPLPLLQQLARQPFVLEHGPTLRVHRFGDLVLLVVHHIAFDGTSLGPLLDTFLHVYRGLPGEAPASDYRAFVAWERDMLASPRAEEHRAWWARHLEGRLPALALPVDRPHPVGQPVHGDTHSERFDPELTRGLFALARSHGVSRSVLCLGMFTRLLMSWCDQEEVMVGMPARGRPEERFRRAVGFFANMLVVRARDTAFARLLKNLQQQVFAGVEHAAWPYWRLTPKLDVERQPGRKPVFQVTFAYQDFHPEAAPVEFVQGLHQAGEYEMVLEVYEEADTLGLHLKYDPAIFDAATIADFMARYRRLASALVRPPACLHTRFEQMAARFPQRVAVRMGRDSLTYEALDRHANRLARGLQARGVQRGELVAVHLDRGLDLIVAFLAVLKAGAAYLPIDTSFPEGRVDAIIKDAGVARVLTSATRLRASFPGPILVEDEQGFADALLQVDAGPDDLAYCIYTSGSTGGPKGVLVEHRQATALIDGPWLAERVSERDVWTLFHSPSFDFSVWEMYGALLHGGTCVIVAREDALDPTRLLRILSEQQVTIFNQTPSAFISLARRAVEVRPRLALRHVLVGGEALSPRALSDFAALYPQARLYNVYGITETTILSTVKRLYSLIDSDNVIGRPFEGCEITLRDERLGLVADGEAGEICVGGTGVSRGYLHRPELTARKFVADPDGQGRVYRSGDVARRLPTGDLQYVARMDAQVQIRGFRVELGEIEHRLAACAGVTDCVVLAPEREGRLVLVAYFTAREPLDVEALRAGLRTFLPDYMIPQALVQLDALPLTVNGKVDRETLAARPIAFTVRVEQPTSDVEGRILSIWKDVLGHDRVGVDDPFFEAGGDSILAATLAARMAAALGREVPVADIFRFPTVRELAGHLAGAQAPVPRPAVRVEAAVPDGFSNAVAIVGISCSLPGADDVRAFWDLLCEGREAVRFLDADELQRRGVDADLLRDPRFVPVESSMVDIEGFDPEFFHLSPHQAELMDPQARQLLMHAWKAIEDAGYRPDQVLETGVFTSNGNTGYHTVAGPRPRHLMEDETYLHWVMSQGGTTAGMIANRLGLRGPAYSLHANCASSMVALQAAVAHLRARDIDAAIVGAATLFADSTPGYVHRPGLNFSSDGHCRPFDAAADGMVGGQGVAVLMLKRAEDAIAAGDPVYAVIRGLVVNNDGGGSVGFFAPSEAGQMRAVARAYETTGISPETIRFVEAHGTATRIGDPIEVAGLTAGFRRFTDRRSFCAIGSVKANVGHLDTAAGLTACIKVALALRHAVIPPTINFAQPNPAIDFTSSPFYVARERERWDGEGPLRAAVSNVGIGGTNAHAILERFPPAVSAPDTGPDVVLLSARTPERLRASAGQLLAFLDQGTRPRLCDVAHTLRVGRVAMACRVAFHAADLDDLRGQLVAYLQTPPAPPAQAPTELADLLGRDPDHRAMVRGWLEAGQVRKCAELWVRGLEVEWEALPGIGRRINLPTYPFERERYSLRRPTAEIDRPAVASERPRAATEPEVDRAAAAPPPPRLRVGGGMQARVLRHLSRSLGLPAERIEPHRPLGDYGLDSIASVHFLERLGGDLGRSLPADLLYDFPSVEKLVAFLGEEAESIDEVVPVAAPSAAPVSAEAIAVIGVAGRFPGAADVERFWENMAGGVDAVTEIPASRWDYRPYHDPNPMRLGTIYCKWGGFLDEVNGFDAAFFGIPEREAPWYGPGERLFLETAWSAMEAAGYTRARLRAAGRVGVFVGADTDDCALSAADDVQRAVLSVTASQAAIASRVSHVFDLRGPSLTMSSMGSSSLASVHEACERLRAGACEMALAGGVNLHLGPHRYRGLCSLGRLASHPDERGLGDGEGYIPAEAVAAVLLKPLAAARRDGDPIVAVILASDAAHGGQGLGLTAPSPAAQSALIAETLRRAGVEPAAVGYVEASPRGRAGSAERAALKRVFPECPVGSAASSIGHAEAASGIVGLIKTIHEARRAAAVGVVTAFGEGGANAVVVLQAAMVESDAEEIPQPLRFPLSARTPEALRQRAAQLGEHLRRHPATRLVDVAHTLQYGREAMSCQVVLTADGRDALCAMLDAFASTGEAPVERDCGEVQGGRTVALPTYPFERRPFAVRAKATVERGSPVELEARIREVLEQASPDERIDLIEQSFRLKVDPRELAGRPVAALSKMLTDRALGRFPLSEGQKGLWLLYQMDPESSLYNAAVAVRIRDARLPVDRLAEAVRLLVEWHPQLAVLIGESGEASQRPADVSPGLVVAGRVEGDVQPFLAARAARPMRLDIEPPARFELFESGPGEHVLLITVHHIVNDGTSLMVLWESLAAAYADLRQGRMPRCRAPRATYRDFVAWESAMLAGPEGQAHLEYWRAQLAPPLPVLDLPTDRPRGPAGPRGQRNRSVEGDGARALAAAHSVPESVLFLALFNVLLAERSGQRELVVGMPVIGRPEARFGKVLGYFVNMMAVRSAVEPELPFSDYVKRLRATMLEGLRHGSYPFPALVRALAPPRHPFRHPVFSVSYAYQNFMSIGAYRAPAEAGAAFEFIDDVLPVGDGDLALSVMEQGQTFRLSIDFDRGLFDEGTIDGMLERMTELLSAVERAPEVRVGALGASCGVPGAGGRPRLESVLLGTPAVMAASVWPLIARHPSDVVAVTCEGQALTYAQLLSRAGGVAAAVAERGARLVAVGLQRGVDLPAVLLGVLSAGAAFVVLDPDLPPARRASLLDDCRPDLLISSQSIDGLPRLDPQDLGEASISPVTDAAAAAYVVYTSGSTGRPKGVIVEQGSLATHCLTMVDALGLRASDRVLQFASFSFDVALEQLFAPLVAGARVVMRPDDVWTGPRCLEVLRAEGVTVADFPPQYFASLVREWRDVPSLRLVVLGGDVFPAGAFERFREAAPAVEVVNAYGPTEATVTATVHRATGRGAQPIGRPLPGRRIYVLDEQLRPVPGGTVGELFIGGQGVARGYLGAPELTAARFLPDPEGGRMYRTGDRARVGRDGSIEFVGRVDREIKVRGFRVAPEEIEQALLAHPGVRGAVVSLEEGQLVARVDGDADVRAWLEEQLPAHMVPRIVGAAAGRAFEAPVGEREELLARLWEEALGISGVGRRDNFFERGGDSILALGVVARAQAAGLALRVADFFAHQVLCDLAAHAGVAAPASRTVESGGPIPLTPIQRDFFEQDLPQRNRHNLCMLLVTRPGLDARRLEGAVRRVVAHHDALRYSFAGGEQRCRADAPPAFRVVDGLDRLEAVAEEMHGSLDIEGGALFRVAWFNAGDAPGRLLMVVHHLVVDGVSLRILAEDLAAAHDGKPLLSSSPYAVWARRLEAYAASAELEAEAPLWLERVRPSLRLPGDPEVAGVRGMDLLSLMMPVEAAVVPLLDEALLAALVETVTAETGGDGLLVERERHGREERFPEVDLSRTVGWFTAPHPVYIERRGDMLAAVREALARVPGQGVGFGVMATMARESLRTAVRALPRPQVAMNYMGRFDASAAFGPFDGVALEDPGVSWGEAQVISTDLMLTAVVREGDLAMSWFYNKGWRRREAVQALAEDYRARLGRLLERALSGVRA